MSANLFTSAIASLLISVSPTKTTNCFKNCVTSDSGVALIAYFEGYSPVRYNDAAGYPTIGYGHLLLPGETYLYLTPDQAKELLRKDVAKHAAPLNRQLRVNLFQHQFDPLVSFAFNLGNGALNKSTLLRRVQANNHKEAAKEFNKWVFAGGIKLRGLVIRRQAESIMYQGQ